MQMVRFVLGLVMTVVCLGLAGRRRWFPYRLGKTGQPPKSTGRAAPATPVRPRRAGRGGRAAQAARVDRARRRAHRHGVLGFMVLFTVVEASGRLVWSGFPDDPVVGPTGRGSASSRTSSRCWPPCSPWPFSSSSGSGCPEEPRPPVEVLVPTSAGLVRPVHDLQRRVGPLLALRGASINAQEVATSGKDAVPSGCLRVAVVREALRAAGPATPIEILETVPAPAPLRCCSSSPSSSPTASTCTSSVDPQCRVARRPGALGGLLPVYSNGKKVDRGPGRRRPHGRRQDRGLHLEGPARLRHLHRSGRCQSQCPAWNTGKPLSPKILAMTPARPRAGQGAIPARDQGRGRRADHRADRR